MKIHFNKTYFTITLLLFITEVLIAIYLKNGFIRHTFGDFLIVIFIYYFVKSFLEINVVKLAVTVLLFSFFVEFLQLFNILKLLNLENNQIAKIILGNTFNLSDLMAYTLGIVTVLSIHCISTIYQSNNS